MIDTTGIDKNDLILSYSDYCNVLILLCFQQVCLKLYLIYLSTFAQCIVSSALAICHAGLNLTPSSALVELLQRVEAAIREYSEELVNQLARREELEFEKEVKNMFITTLLEVQNRQREQRDGSKRRRRDKALSLQGGGLNTGNTGPHEKMGSMPVKVSSLGCHTLLLIIYRSLHQVRPFYTEFLHFTSVLPLQS